MLTYQDEKNEVLAMMLNKLYKIFQEKPNDRAPTI